MAVDPLRVSELRNRLTHHRGAIVIAPQVVSYGFHGEFNEC